METQVKALVTRDDEQAGSMKIVVTGKTCKLKKPPDKMFTLDKVVIPSKEVRGEMLKLDANYEDKDYKLVKTILPNCVFRG